MRARQTSFGRAMFENCTTMLAFKRSLSVLVGTSLLISTAGSQTCQGTPNTDGGISFCSDCLSQGGFTCYFCTGEGTCHSNTSAAANCTSGAGVPSTKYLNQMQECASDYCQPFDNCDDCQTMVSGSVRLGCAWTGTTCLNYRTTTERFAVTSCSSGKPTATSSVFSFKAFIGGAASSSVVGLLVMWLVVCQCFFVFFFRFCFLCLLFITA
eukprot:m.150280 g.150280  ORF g.150280 m.150280 type:complete len:211 (-) comp30718_c4_seq3:384-1016(-)